VLLLGAGMGSTMEIFGELGCKPRYTLVDADKETLRWAMEYAPAAIAQLSEPVCSDAAVFMEQNKRQYDFVFIDIFIGRHVPEFVVSQSFLQHCKTAVTPNGHLAFNYIINDATEWLRVQEVFAAVFLLYTIIEKGENRIFVV
jgi:spermidine synthase